MDCYEKYYRRSYNALNRLIEAYKDGYSFNKMLEFRKDFIEMGTRNEQLMKSEQLNLMVTIIIAMLGLNKEAIERTGKIIEYSTNTFTSGVRNFDLNAIDKQRLIDFDSKKNINTPFDNWLSIITNPATDVNNIDFIRRVRNGLLHSNFYVDEDSSNLSFTHIKTKSYYESELLNIEFQMFVFEYFSNLERLGLTEKMYLFDIKNNQVKNKNELRDNLEKLMITSINYDSLVKLDYDTPELALTELSTLDGRVDIIAFINKIAKSNNFENFHIDTFTLEPYSITEITNYLEAKFGQEFYNLNGNTQCDIITAQLHYFLNPKREIGNWLSHFWYLINGMTSDKFNPIFFTGDEYGNESCYPSLMILKSYLIIYRLQNNNFSEIDYSNVNLDYTNMYLWCEDANGDNKNLEYYKDCYKKEITKDPLKSVDEIWNKVVCEVIRNGLAHGNINVLVSSDYQQSIIEIKDINKKHNTLKGIRMPVEQFDIFLNSEAFAPKNCYLRKEDELIRKREK